MEWISAKAARLALAAALNDRLGWAAGRTICEHAADGLIVARASSFVLNDAPAISDYDLPKLFWYARGNARLTQDWNIGQFSTLISGDHHKAYGVTFMREHLVAAGALFEASESAPTDKTGGPGRPTSVHIIETMMRDRAASGRLASSLGAEAKELVRLFKADPEYVKLAQPKPKTIENNLRDLYRALKPNP